MNKTKMTLLILAGIILQSQKAFCSETSLNCRSVGNPNQSGRLGIYLSNQHITPGSGYFHMTHVNWSYQFSSARMICNQDLINLNDETNLECVGYVFGGKIQVSGNVSKRGGRLIVHNLDASNAYAEETEGMNLTCEPVKAE